MLKEQDQYYAITHRGDDDTNFGVHTRLPLALKDLSVNSLLVLAFIDIDQFQDTRFRKGGKRSPIKIATFINGLGISERSVRYALKELIKKQIITTEYREKIGTCYMSNILKLNVRYQIITLAFIIRLDISVLAKALVLRVLMASTDRVSELGTIAAVSREVGMSRTTIYKIFDELSSKDYIIYMQNKAYAIDIERLMLDSDVHIAREVIDLRKRNQYLIGEIKKVNPAWREG